MLQITVDRLKKLRSTKEIYIITRKELHDTIASEIIGIDPKNIVIEPSGKNTAPAIGLMALKITEYEPEAIMGVFPADHLIVGHRDFENTIDQADLMAKKNSSLITIGIDPTDASVALRFEVYYQGIELANGFHELTDVNEQTQRFHQDNAKRVQMGLAEKPLDQHFLAALNAGLPDCIGVALGIDRLLMLKLGVDSISEVMAFDSNRA